MSLPVNPIFCQVSVSPRFSGVTPRTPAPLFSGFNQLFRDLLIVLKTRHPACFP
jgi:hypothetical protein